MSWINKVSEEALDIGVLENASDESVGALGRLYRVYQEQLEEHDALDFSTIQFEALRLLESHSEVLKKSSRYLSVCNDR